MKNKTIQSTLKIPDGFTSSFVPVFEHQVHTLESDNRNLEDQIVMIHGALASRRYLLPAAVSLSKSMRVFIPELPGHGASSRPSRALSVQEHAEVLFDWFRIKELSRVHLYANSYGCQIAAQLVANHPELARNLILTGPTTDPKARAWVPQMYRLYMDGFFEPKGARSQLFADLSDMGIPITCQTIQHMIDNDIRPMLAKIKCRTLVLRGEKDPIAPQLWTEEVARRIPDSRFCVIPDAPHCVNYATPAELTNIILKFVTIANIH